MTGLKQTLIVAHRWLGVVLCLGFMLWFPSGFVMMYWGYPSVRDSDRLARAPALDASRIGLSPVEAAAKAGIEPTAPVRLNIYDGRPVYRFGGGRDQVVVYADTGEARANVSKHTIDRIASAWVGQPILAATVQAIDDVDQWTLGSRIRDLAPLWKYSWPDGQEVYASQASGEVIQYTTTATRWGAYLGAIPHWFYFAPLRRHGQAWSRLVIGLSGCATVAAVLGVAIGAWSYSASKRYRHKGAPTSIPYRGWKRWHAIIGLLVGIGAATWAFSGLLSMEPFPQPGRRTDAGEQRRRAQRALEALGGRAPLDQFAAKDPRVALVQLAHLQVKELEWISFAGEAAYLATIGPDDTRRVPVEGDPQKAADGRRITDIVARIARAFDGANVSVMSQYDRYYLDRRREAPLPVVLVELNDPDHTRYYIDPESGHVVGRYSTEDWMDRWLDHGLHSLNFPWLYNYRPAWDVIVIAFMTAGTALSATSVVLAWQVVGRKLRVLNG